MENDNLKGMEESGHSEDNRGKETNSIGAKPAFKKENENFVTREEHKFRDILLDHEPLKVTLDWLLILLGTFVSAICFTYGFRAFTAPTYQVTVSTLEEIDGVAHIVSRQQSIPHLVSGGISGISQTLLRLFQIFGYPSDAVSENTFTSIAYFAINIPLFIIAFRYVGKKFTLVTFINVVLSSILIRYIPESWVSIFNSMSGDYIARAIFAGLLTGISSGLAYVVGSSTGGVDIVTYVIAEKKGTTVGKYYIIINAITISLYTVFNAIKIHSLDQVSLSLYTLIYFFVTSKTLDVINIKNKKTELQINTDNDSMALLLLRSFPHGCTVIDAVGGYTGKKRKVIYMVVSASEVKGVVGLARKIDPHCFVNATNSTRVYGRFYTKPMD